MLRRVLDLLRSPRLALALLIAILVACLVGVVFVPPALGPQLVFSSLWFNGLLVLLVLNTALCFFSRIPRRGWSLVSFGMIIFHLSFVAIFTGVVIDRLFYFKGALRLTEGETIGLGDSKGYDAAVWGAFFNHDRMKGDVTFHKLLTDYVAESSNKGTANEISIVAEGQETKAVVFPTRHLAFNGFKLFRNTDGFAPLFILSDQRGNIVFGGYTPLQSFRQPDQTMLYSTGTRHGPAGIDFPQIAGMPPLFKIQFIYHLPTVKTDAPSATFRVWEFDEAVENGLGRLLHEGSAPLGEKVSFGGYAISLAEVRYWASMDVLYHPGQPIVLASFWAGLSGLVLTLAGRLRSALLRR